MRYWLVMPAAGVGTRFGERVPKQYAPLRGRTVIEWALAPFLADGRCSGAAVALASGDTWWPKVAERIPAVTVCQGGAQRSESVRNALLALNRRAGKGDWVLVHDAARPGLTSDLVTRLIEEVDSNSAGGLLALPLADTLKREHNGRSTETIPRAHLWQAQTPQMFQHQKLQHALQQALEAGQEVTDEASAIEALGWHPKLVAGTLRNMKITYAQELDIVAKLMELK